ncbi:hypothetical protein ACVWXN_010842 [Bradyrhizobium sp. i1.4.4]
MKMRQDEGKKDEDETRCQDHVARQDVTRRKPNFQGKGKMKARKMKTRCQDHVARQKYSIYFQTGGGCHQEI